MSNAHYPTSASFACGPYSDGSGHEVVVSYDTGQHGVWADKICLNGLDVSFDYQHAEAVIDAIRFCARALEARKP